MDSVGLVMFAEDIGFAEAVKKLGGSDGRKEPGAKTRVQPSSKKVQPTTLPDLTSLMLAQERLLWGEEGATVLDYLVKRGFSELTIERYRLGAKQHRFGLAVAIPWISENGQVTAIKYRLLRPLESTTTKPSLRYLAERGSQVTGFFGLRQLNGERQLVIVEGELNALAVYEAAGGVVDVLSAGSESTCVVKAWQMLFKKPDQVLVWMDRKKLVLTAAKIRNSVLFESPGGKDANDLLIEEGSGILRKLIVRRLEQGREHLPGVKSAVQVRAQNSLAPARSGQNLELVTESGIPRPAHLVREVAYWTDPIARNHAWKHWVDVLSKRPNAPKFATVPEAIDYVLESWRSSAEQA
jgi:hypothetical protein